MNLQNLEYAIKRVARDIVCTYVPHYYFNQEFKDRLKGLKEIMKESSLTYEVYLTKNDNMRNKLDYYQIDPVRRVPDTKEVIPWIMDKNFPTSNSLTELGAHETNNGILLYDTRKGVIGGKYPFAKAKTIEEANKKLAKRAKDIGDIIAKECNLEIKERPQSRSDVEEYLVYTWLPPEDPKYFMGEEQEPEMEKVKRILEGKKELLAYRNKIETEV